MTCCMLPWNALYHCELERGFCRTEVGCQASQAKVLTGERKLAQSTSRRPRLLAIPAFDRIAGLYNRHLNSNRAIT